MSHRRVSTIPDGTTRDLTRGAKGVETKQTSAALVRLLESGIEAGRADLMKRARRGEPEAVRALWETYRCRITVGGGPA